MEKTVARKSWRICRFQEDSLEEEAVTIKKQGASHTTTLLFFLLHVCFFCMVMEGPWLVYTSFPASKYRLAGSHWIITLRLVCENRITWNHGKSTHWLELLLYCTCQTQPPIIDTGSCAQVLSQQQTPSQHSKIKTRVLKHPGTGTLHSQTASWVRLWAHRKTTQPCGGKKLAKKSKEFHLLVVLSELL